MIGKDDEAGMLPVFIWNNAGPCAGLNEYIERISARSSTCSATCGKSSETSIPLCPCFLKFQNDGIRPPGVPIVARTSPTFCIVSPWYFRRSGLGSKVSTWLTPP
jgi:hypothetical protein